MAWREYNANPDGHRGIDCTVRAISEVVGKSWEEVYVSLCVMGFIFKDMPSADAVWGQYLRAQGFRRYVVGCRDIPCTVEEFCREHDRGEYLLSVSGHVVAVRDGDWYDTWDSGGEFPVYFWAKGV